MSTIIDIAKAVPALRGSNRAVLTLTEAGKIISVTTTHLANLIEAREIDALNVASATATKSSFRIPIAGLLAYIERKANVPSADRAWEQKQATAQPGRRVQ